MLLSLSEDALHTFADEMALIDPESDSESESYGYKNDYDDYNDYGGSPKKRKATNDLNKTAKAPRRLGSTATSKPNRVYFRWAGEGTNECDLEDMIELRENCGYLDFEPSKAIARE
ncbi:hypothetical protein BDW74DRAFT_152070 [Aspergillus multicolor]|uniref:uncharacterized protein n=1 Tax=Aspergillus multicolor TaxID=41759 RepID=UPI003CCD3878